MAKKSAVLAVKIVSDARGAKKGFDKASGDANKFSSQMKKMAATLAASLGFKKVITELFELGSAFDQTWKNLRIGTGATGDDFAALQDSVRKVSGEVPGLAGGIDQIGTTLGDLNTRLGVTGPDLEMLTSQFVTLSNLGVDADIDSVAAAMNSYNVEVKDMPGEMDKLLQVHQATGLSITELANSALKAGPGLRAFGFDMADSAALIGTMDKAGIDADGTLGRLTRAFGEFAEAGRDPQEALQETVGEIEKFVAAGDMGEAASMAEKLFGTRGSVQFIDAVQSGVLSVEDFAAAAGVGSDTILELGEELQSFPEKWQLFKQSAALALEPLASTIFESIEGPLDSAGSAITENASIFATLTTAVLVFTGAITAARIAQMIFNTVMAANPIVRVVAIVLALAAALVVAYQNSETFRNIVDRAGQIAVNAFRRARDGIQPFIDRIKSVIDWVARLIDRIRSISFPSPPGWMSNLLGGSIHGHDSVLGIPPDSGVFRFMAPPALTFGAGAPDITAASPLDVLTALSRGGGFGRGGGGQMMVDNSVHITVDGSGIVDPRRVADAIRQALTDDGRTRGLTPAAGKGRLWQ